MDNLDQKHTHYINREVATYRDRIAMVCLTESRTNLLMWSHYADQHAGFVIGVHTAHPCFNRQRSEADDHNYFRPVIYSDVRPNFYMNQIRSREPIILTKSREWKDEKEWRIVAPLELLTKDPKNGKYFYDLPIEAIKEVYMGCEFHPPFGTGSSKNWSNVRINTPSNYSRWNKASATTHWSRKRCITELDAQE